MMFGQINMAESHLGGPTSIPSHKWYTAGNPTLGDNVQNPLFGGMVPMSGGGDTNGGMNVSDRPFQIHKMMRPPKFLSHDMDQWKRDVLYWRDLYNQVPEGQVIANIGLQTEEELKEVMFE